MECGTEAFEEKECVRRTNEGAENGAQKVRLKRGAKGKKRKGREEKTANKRGRAREEETVVPSAENKGTHEWNKES